MSKPVDLGSVKTGSYILIDGEPCKIVQYDKSKPGKHGSLRYILTGKDIFNNDKYEDTWRPRDIIEVPILKEREYTLLLIDDQD